MYIYISYRYENAYVYIMYIYPKPYGLFITPARNITPGPNLDQVDPTRHDMLPSWTSTSRSNLQVCTVELRTEKLENACIDRKNK